MAKSEITTEPADKELYLILLCLLLHYRNRGTRRYIINDSLIDVIRGPQTWADRAVKRAQEDSDRALENAEWVEDQRILIAHGLPPATIDPVRLPTAAENKRRAPKRNYRQSDAMLIEEIRQGVASGIYGSLWEGCQALAPRAEGTGSTVESKATRLWRRPELHN